MTICQHWYASLYQNQTANQTTLLQLLLGLQTMLVFRNFWSKISKACIIDSFLHVYIKESKSKMIFSTFLPMALRPKLSLGLLFFVV
jgi:hypothetical protein